MDGYVVKILINLRSLEDFSARYPPEDVPTLEQKGVQRSTGQGRDNQAAWEEHCGFGCFSTSLAVAKVMGSVPLRV